MGQDRLKEDQGKEITVKMSLETEEEAWQEGRDDEGHKKEWKTDVMSRRKKRKEWKRKWVEMRHKNMQKAEEERQEMKRVEKKEQSEEKSEQWRTEQ